MLVDELTGVLSRFLAGVLLGVLAGVLVAILGRLLAGEFAEVGMIAIGGIGKCMLSGPARLRVRGDDVACGTRAGDIAGDAGGRESVEDLLPVDGDLDTSLLWI